MADSYTAGVPIFRLTAEVVKNLSAASGVAYMKSEAILTLLAAPNPAPKRYLQTARDSFPSLNEQNQRGLVVLSLLPEP